MKIVLAPNAFKGSMTAAEAAAAMENGIRNVIENVDVARVPVADGGDGVLEVLLASFQGDRVFLNVNDPVFKPVKADLGYFPKERFAVIEMAKASGLALLKDQEKNPERTTTYGTGELIGKGVKMGASSVYVGIGGSATCDGAIGLASALGIRFLDKGGNDVKPTGGGLTHVRKIDVSGVPPAIKNCKMTVICDVDNPLLGENGAARVYGPQKGATPEQVIKLEAGLANLADVIERDLGMDVRTLPGGGAAGGMGAGLCAFFNAGLKKGIDTVLELVKLGEKLDNADLVLTAEGQMDGQTVFGKAPAGVAKLAKAKGIPCIAIAGSFRDDLTPLHQVGIDAVFSLCPGPVSLETAMGQGATFLANAAEQVFRAFLCGKNKTHSRKCQS